MSTNPTVDEVRELLRRYRGEPPEPPQCSVCAKPMFVSEISSVGFKFGCHCGHEVRSSEPYLFDEEVVKLCNHFLASPMTAGEFAGLVVKEIEAARDYWERASLELKPPTSDRCETRRAILDSEGIGGVRKVAREHNITIVEPKK